MRQGLREPIWLESREVAAINAQSIALFGGLPGKGDEPHGLHAALARPRQKWHYAERKPDLFMLAAATCAALIKGHVFPDGNKRTAYIASVVFLEINGYQCIPAQSDIVHTMREAAANAIDEELLAAWFRHNSQMIMDHSAN